ncbi:hypothetical protein D3C81_1057770 [compost metagenome]
MLIGLLRRAITFLVDSNVFLNINLLLSKLPNKFDTALYFEPFTFSNSNAGPLAEFIFRCIAAISR